jgi:hypothetical protein
LKSGSIVKAMAEKVVYKERHMYEICGGDKSFCNFDLSRIPSTDYEGFFNGITNIIYKKCQHIRFSCDLEERIKEGDPVTKEELADFNNSIKSQRPRSARYLAKILAQILPRSKMLRKLVLKDIEIPSSYFRDFVIACSRCPVLRILELEGVTISYEDSVLIFERLSPFRLEEISLVACGLRDRLYEHVSKFLTQRTPAGKVWKLCVLNLADNHFKPHHIGEIPKLLENALEAKEVSEESESEVEIILQTLPDSSAQVAIAQPNEIPAQTISAPEEGEGETKEDKGEVETVPINDAENQYDESEGSYEYTGSGEEASLEESSSKGENSDDTPSGNA